MSYSEHCCLLCIVCCNNLCSALKKFLQGPVKSRSGIDEVIEQRAAELAMCNAEAETTRFATARALTRARGQQVYTDI
jgi:hypothetical protein